MQTIDIELVMAVQDHLYAAALGLARIATCVAWLPYFGAGALPSKVLKTLVGILIYLGLGTAFTAGQAGVPDGVGLFMLLSEGVIGTGLGLAMAAPYHLFHALGGIIDGQRGGSVGALVDPLSGVEATETSNLLQLAAACMFLSTGGMVGVLEVLRTSYEMFPAGAGFQLRPDALTDHLSVLFSNLLRIAGPVLVLLLMVDMMLGVLSRFAQQLNAFSLTLSVKSVVAFAAMLAYVFACMSGEVQHSWESSEPLRLFVPGGVR